MSRTIKKAINLTDDELAEVSRILKGRAQSHTSFRNAHDFLIKSIEL